MLFTFSHCSIKFLSWPLKRRFTADYSEKVRAITDMKFNTIVHLLLLFSLKISSVPAPSEFFLLETEDGEKRHNNYEQRSPLIDCPDSRLQTQSEDSSIRDSVITHSLTEAYICHKHHKQCLCKIVSTPDKISYIENFVSVISKAFVLLLVELVSGCLNWLLLGPSMPRFTHFFW